MDLVTLFHQLTSSPHVKAWLKQQLLIPLLQYDARVRELEVAVQNLNKKRNDLGHKVDEEENRYGRGIPDGVKKWIEEVDKIICDYDDFHGDERHKLAKFDLFGTGYLPNPGIRYRLSRKAFDITNKVNGLLQRTEQDWLSYWADPPSMAAFLSVAGYEVFASREEIVKNIEAAFEASNVRMIGLHGLSGVGKTTLVKKVAKKALDDKKFNVVIMASVTQNVDMKKIQGQIADMLGIKLDEESDIARAARIRKNLKNDKKSTLIILDDLWATLDFNMLGIPSENDDGAGVENVKMAIQSDDVMKNVEKGQSSKIPSNNNQKMHNASNGMKRDGLSRYKGCKVLLISEIKQVLLSHMEGKENSIFSLQVLKDKEAKTLFKIKAEIVDTNPKFEKLAAQIVEKCEGLPMSIVTIARALKNQSQSIWEDFNRKLEREKLTGAPEFSTKLSYELLENEELKYTFLLCARMGHDALIMDLVKYCIGLGFLQGIYTVREARNRVYAMVEKLKETGLLSNSYSNDLFTMQAIVRSAALSIAFEEKLVFMMTRGKLDEWPDEDKLKMYAGISLHHCAIIDGFPSVINCPRLRVFHVNNSDPHLEIPYNLFEGMKELKVLILTGFNLLSLPSSITCLTKLRMLCLEHCMLGEEFSIIGKLKKLRILSFSGSNIEKLPVQLKQLTKLQIFDISNCSKLGEIPSNVLKCLISLEELYMRNTLINWNIEGEANQSENASLSELRHLNQLTTLDIQIRDVAQLPNNLFFDKLNNYKIVIGDLNAYLETDFKMPEKHEALRFLAVQLKNGFDIHSLEGIKMLFDRVENLLLGDRIDVQDIFYGLNLKGFSYLKHLSIVNNSDIQSLINSEDSQQFEEAFPKLESLYLYNLRNMDKICKCKLSKPSFGELKVIKINLCGHLKNVFSFSMVRLLTVLETIEVSECNSLKEITQSDTKEIEFPELRSLTLQSLPEFMGFYPIPSREGETRELFHKKVVVSKLERMELSMIQVDKIWSDDQLSQSSDFKNLMHLDVNGCSNLEYLLSFSVAESLVNLQSLLVNECVKMRQIVYQGEESNVQMKGIFPNLKNIKLSSMKSLTEIWNAKLHPNSFGKLDTLIIEQCDKFVNVFPFRSLCSLRVTNCKSMKEIFELDVMDVTDLQEVHLEALPKLKHIWKRSKDEGRIPNLEKLQKLSIHYCVSLEYIFPFFEVMCLPNLESLVVWWCSELREIVSKGRGINTNTSSSKPSFVFPNLTTIKFSALQRLKSFYPEDYELSCPILSDLSIEHCHMMKPFIKETANAQTVIFPEEVINKLKSMQIESWHAMSSNNYMKKRNYRRKMLEELCLSRLVNTEILYYFLRSNPNLKSLSLIACSFKEVVPPNKPPGIRNLGVVPKLKSLKLIDLPELVEIGFERDIVLLEKIEFLVLEKCPCLETIVPSSVSFTHLTNLEVVNCTKLKYLMPPSAAKSLIQLITMKVIKCESLKEIVSEQGSEENGNKVDIVFFRQLKALELVSLKSLESFCSSKSYVFEFSSLENIVVSACPKMENFCEEVKSTPILQKVYVVREQQKRCSWHGNLKDTIQKISVEKKYFEGMDEVNLSEHVELQKTWHDGVGFQKNWFYSLKTLKLVKCEIQPYAIPSHILPYLSNLNELVVRRCKKVEAIFEMNDSEVMETASQLKILTLGRLSELKQVWKMNHQGIPQRFHENLQQVLVNYCNSLETLFPLALAKNVKKLEKIKISNCDELQEIVEKEEAPAAQVTEKFVFPCLTSLDLSYLAQLTYFYHKTFSLECPALNHLSVTDCNKLELFQSVHPEDEGESSSVSNNRQSLFSDIKAISNLEKLKLYGKHTLELLRSRLTEDLIYLNELEVRFDENEKLTLPFEILQKAPYLECMRLSNCNIVEEFLSPNPKIVEHLKILDLCEVSKLQSFGSENSSWLNTICDRLNKLYVSYCPDLTAIVHSSVSFSCLKELFIFRCDGLKYLFTSTTAEKLRNLEVMRVLECESMEVVAKKEDQTTSGVIKFERLCTIELSSLSSLECFHSGNDTLELPSLILVNIRQCLKMEFFSRGLTNAQSFRGIFRSYLKEELVFHKDLNGSLKWVLLQRDHLVLGDSPILKRIWCKLEPVPDWCFCNLKSLVVEGCDFLSNAILPSHLLPFLSNLEELQVRKCNSVKAIFDDMINLGRASYPLSIPLKKLILEHLPSLKDIWNMDPQGSLSLPFLEEVLVDGCNSIEYLFPASVVKNRLQKLEVKSCEELVLISAKDKATTEEAKKELCIFPSLISLRLRDLPNLQRIYPGMRILEWPMLKELDVFRCQMLKFFVTNSPTDSDPDSQDSSPTDEEKKERIYPRVHILEWPMLKELDVFLYQMLKFFVTNSPTDDEQGFVSLQKVTPHLEKLWLREEEATMIEQGKLHVDLQRLDSLHLEGFHNEFPFVFCSKFPFPSIEKLLVVDSAFKEIFPATQRRDIDYTKILSQLIGLQLQSLSQLTSIGFDHSWMGPFLENLVELIVLDCDCLTNLTPSTVSFSNLTNLGVKDCGKLEYLFTSSTAKTLGALKVMTIANCESMEEIVAEDYEEVEEIVAEDYEDEDEGSIIFGQLEVLELSSLPKLQCFYSGSSTLNFSSLKDVSFTQVSDGMNFFRQGYILPNKLECKIDGGRYRVK